MIWLSPTLKRLEDEDEDESEPSEERRGAREVAVGRPWEGTTWRLQSEEEPRLLALRAEI